MVGCATVGGVIIGCVINSGTIRGSARLNHHFLCHCRQRNRWVRNQWVPNRGWRRSIGARIRGRGGRGVVDDKDRGWGIVGCGHVVGNVVEGDQTGIFGDHNRRGEMMAHR